MGLPSLEQKIQKGLEQKNYSEGDVLYLMVEMGKYLERSGKDLDPTIAVKLNPNDFRTITFFRNWAAHPVIDRPIPEYISQIFRGMSEKDSRETEEVLFSLLREEIGRFCDITRLDINKNEINWDSFFDSLKKVLAEQPVQISYKGKYIGYDEALTLKMF